MHAHHIQLPQGAPDLLILQALALEPRHGWAVSERVQQISGDVLRILQGSFYSALHRLESRAEYYELAKTGRRQLECEKAAWGKLTAAVAQVPGAA
jgi:DNA-binding PadR family transcriptional regulator